MTSPPSTWRSHPFTVGQAYIAKRTFNARPGGQFVKGRRYVFDHAGYSHYDSSTVFAFHEDGLSDPVCWGWHDDEPESKCAEAFEPLSASTMNPQNTSVCEHAYQRAISGEFSSADEAIAFLEKFQGQCRTNLLFQSRLAALYCVVGRVDDAERLIQDGLMHDPTHEKLLFSLGDIRLKQRKLDAVVAIASKLIEHHPSTHGGYYLMQLGLIYAGRYEDSIGFGREAMRRAELPALWLNEAVAMFQLERFEHCMAAAYHAIALSPSVLQERWGINEAIYALAKQGKEGEALELALQRQRVTPNWQADPVFVKALTLLTT